MILHDIFGMCFFVGNGGKFLVLLPELKLTWVGKNGYNWPKEIAQWFIPKQFSNGVSSSGGF